MDLLPIKHNLSNVVEDDWKLAGLYEAAGMKQKATELKKLCVVKVCNENSIPIITSSGKTRVSLSRIWNWDGSDWDVESLGRLSIDIPVSVLQNMALVKEQDRLRIAIPKTRAVTDPVLLYQLPYFYGDAFIELARWE